MPSEFITENDGIYDPLNAELNDFKNKINSYMKKSDEYLNADHSLNMQMQNTILLRTLPEKNKNDISPINRYKSEVYSNMALATTRLRAIFELIDIEIEDEKQKNEIKEKVYGNFKETMKFFQDELERKEITDQDFSKEAKRLKKAQFNSNTQIYHILKKSKLDKDCTRKIDMLNGMQTMHFEAKTIITTYKIEKNGIEYTRVTQENPIDPLSQEMKGRIQNGEYQKDDWYKTLPDFEKKVFERYKDEIISGHPIPNMINFIPGIRNAFNRIDTILDVNDKEIARTSMIHSAHPTVIQNKQSRKLTKENVEHLESTSDKKLFLSGLITPSYLVSQEKRMHKDLKKRNFLKNIKYNAKSNTKSDTKSEGANLDIKKQNSSYGNIPMNVFRFISSSNLKKNHINEFMCEALRKIIIKQKPEHAKYAYILNNIHSIKELRTYIGKSPELDDKSHKILKTIKFLDKNLNHYSQVKMILSQLRGKNLSVEINANLHLLIDQMNDFNKEGASEELITPVVFCKSGKDRTGIQEEYSTAKILANQQTVFSEKELFKHSIESNHLRFMNGSQYGGNGAGLNGVLYSPTNVHSNDYGFFKKNLYTDVSSGNHFKYQKEGMMKYFNSENISNNRSFTSYVA